MAATTLFANLESDAIPQCLHSEIPVAMVKTQMTDASCLRDIKVAQFLLASFGICFKATENPNACICRIRERICFIKSIYPGEREIDPERIVSSPWLTIAFFERLKKIELVRTLGWVIQKPPGMHSIPNPEDIPGCLQSIKQTNLSLRNKYLLSLPREICSLPLTFLDISNNCIRTLPSEILLMRQLETFYAGGNPIEMVPEVIQKMQNLQDLTIDFDYGVGDQVIEMLEDIEVRTGLLTRFQIYLPENESKQSQLHFLQKTIALLNEIRQRTSEPKSATVLLVQPAALEKCLKKALKLTQ